MVEQQRRGREELRALTQDDAVALHWAAGLAAGREPTPDELRGLLKRREWPDDGSGGEPTGEMVG